MSPLFPVDLVPEAIPVVRSLEAVAASPFVLGDIVLQLLGGSLFFDGKLPRMFPTVGSVRCVRIWLRTELAGIVGILNCYTPSAGPREQRVAVTQNPERFLSTVPEGPVLVRVPLAHRYP